MWSHYLATLYRSLTRHRLYAALNVFGLAVGIAVFLVLWLDVRFETGFDTFIPHAREVWIVRQHWSLAGIPPETNNQTMGGLLEELRADYPQLRGVRLEDDSVIVRQHGVSTADRATFVDPSFFDIFDLPLIEGDGRRALLDPSALILTETTARRYFGSSDPMGHDITLSVEGVARSYHVAAVLKDLPKSSTFKISMLTHLTPVWFNPPDGPYFYHWGSDRLETYLRFADPAQAKALQGDLNAFVDRHAAKDMGRSPPPHTIISLVLTPLRSVHLVKPADAATVATLGVVGVLTLLLGALNYVNLATARAGLRAREVALRKVMGATGRELTAQFLAEALATVAAAALIGLALVELALPLVNAAGGTDLALRYVGREGVVLPLAAVVAVVGLGAGLYPALVLAHFRAAAVLASARTPGGGRVGARVREGLVLAQFAVAVAFTICTAVLLAQVRHLQTSSVGFRREGLILATSFDDAELTAAQRDALLIAFRGLPGVVSAAQANIAPGHDNLNSDTMTRPGLTGPKPSITWTDTGPGYLQTMGARLVAGRWLDVAHGMDDTSALSLPERDADAGSVIVNERALKALQFASPEAALGHPLQEGTSRNTTRNSPIVGVIADMRFYNPHEQVRPTAYFFRKGKIDDPIATVRYVGADPRFVTEAMKTAWRGIAPGVPFEAKTVTENLMAYYAPDQQRSHLFTIGTVLAVVIGCVGLYGLASFNTARRVKEIGIRKTLGASTVDVLRLLVGQLLRPVLLANLLAWPLAYVAMRTWLGGFDQRIALSPLYFVAATALMLAVALITVVGQALAVARAEPARALRHE